MFYKLLISISLFLILALGLLTKDPVVFPDETSFAMISLNLIEKDLFSTTAFSNQLPAIQLEDLAYHGPVYYWLLAVVFKIFGFSLLSLRLTSVMMGLGVVISVYWLARELRIRSKLAWLPGLLLSVDYNFLRTSRFGRPEILTAWLGVLSLIVYLKLRRNRTWQNYSSLGALLALGILSHLALGWLIPIAIGIHLLISKSWQLLFNKKTIGLLLITGVSLLFWCVYAGRILSDLGKVSTAIGVRFKPSFHSIQMILSGDIVVKTIFLIYGLVLAGLMMIKVKNKQEIFWILVSGVLMAGVILGGIDWYLGLLALPAYVALTMLINRFQVKPNSFQYNGLILIACLVFILSGLEQLSLNIFYKNCNYNDYSRKISDYLPTGAKVWMRPLIPDIAFYLIEKRPDLRLAFEEYFDHDQKNLKTYLDLADYAIIYGVDYQVMNLIGKIEAQQLEQLKQDRNLKPMLVDFLKPYQTEAKLIESSQHDAPIAIYQIKR